MKFVVVLLSIFIASFATAKSLPNKTIHPYGGDLRPWPWGSESTFPWSQIQGVWAPMQVDADGGTAYFIFKIGSKGDDGTRIIKVTEYDPMTCQKIAMGVGIENEKVIYAQMTTGSSIFDLAIRAFDPSILQNPTMCIQSQDVSRSGPVVVLSVYPKASWSQGDNYEMQKLSSSTTPICDTQ